MGGNGDPFQQLSVVARCFRLLSVVRISSTPRGCRRPYKRGATPERKAAVSMGHQPSRTVNRSGHTEYGPAPADTPPLAAVLSPVRRIATELPQPSVDGGGGVRNTHPTVSVIIPTLNEADNLPLVLPLIPAWVHEVVLVDGGSEDGTVDVCRELLPEARIVIERTAGKGRALFTGMHAASGDILATIDADGSMDPAELPRYVYALMAGADFVKGSRFLHGGTTDDMELVRRLGNRALTETVRRLYGSFASKRGVMG